VDQLATLLKEGQQEAVVAVGEPAAGEAGALTAAELAAAEDVLLRAARDAQATATLLRRGSPLTAEYLVRRNARDDDFLEVRVAVVGNVDAGKSTLLGVLTHGELDNGRGRARLQLFRHKHEAETGRTSSIGQDILGFNARGDVVNVPAHDGSLDWA
jgi:GTPase